MDDAADSHRVSLVRDGRDVGTVSVGAEGSILEAAADLNLGMAYGCRDGSCVRCIGRLETGSIDYLREPTALTDEQRESGFVLLCIARPATACRVEIGRAVLEAAFPQLWRSESGFR